MSEGLRVLLAISITGLVVVSAFFAIRFLAAAYG